MNELIESMLELLKDLKKQDDLVDFLEFDEAEFEQIMIGTGWDKAQAWFVYFVELFWRRVFKEDQSNLKELNTLFTSGVMSTWNCFRKSDWVVGESPRVGALSFWQDYKEGKPLVTGKVGIVESIEAPFVTIVEGIVIKDNNNLELLKEHYSIRDTIKPLNYHVMTGLRAKGFVYGKKVF
jgi:hypothetical protein